MASQAHLSLITLSLILVSLLTISCDPYYNMKAMNPIDTCRRAEPNWAINRRALADCAVGFGKNAIGGKFGEIYVVTNPSDNPSNPKPGMLRYGVIQKKPLWIIFAKSMVIRLGNELMIFNDKTIDGRGAEVEIAYGPCITIQHVSHVIIHGISIHDCEPGKAGQVRDRPDHVGRRGGSDGDGIVVYDSTDIWIDHCNLSRCHDGLIDVIHASTAITISNNVFTDHNKVMLLGHDDTNFEDKNMKVTVAFNHFGPDLVQRMPRVRLGYVHVANNLYDSWGKNAIGGSANPTILSEGNYFVAPSGDEHKEVTKREKNKNGCDNWKWRSKGDIFMNGATFKQSGDGNTEPGYTEAQQFKVAEGSMVIDLTAQAGVLTCDPGGQC